MLCIRIKHIWIVHNNLEEYDKYQYPLLVYQDLLSNGTSRDKMGGVIVIW